MVYTCACITMYHHSYFLLYPTILAKANSDIPDEAARLLKSTHTYSTRMNSGFPVLYCTPLISFLSGTPFGFQTHMNYGLSYYNGLVSISSLSI